MTCNNFHQNSAPSFGSRGKGSHLRNITVGIGATPENQPVQTPRSARSALLAGLRTAPKTSNPMPASAAVEQAYDNSRYAGITTPSMGYGQNSHVQSHPRLPTPPSVVPSPSIQVNDGDIDEFDQEAYHQMQLIMAQNAYFSHVQQQLAAAQKVQQLQQQLAQLQMQANSSYSATPPMSPGMGLGNMTGLYNGAAMYSQFNQYQQQQHQQQYAQNHNYGTYNQYQQPLQQQHTQSIPIAHVEVSPPTPIDNQVSPPNILMVSNRDSHSRSPPKLNLQQSNPATAAFRRGHRKTSSLSHSTVLNDSDVAEGPKTSLPSLSRLPSTPTTATFGPGHASGTHPLRQPRGPPSIEELKAKPTSKDEGSKNFATRQRRRAISRLVSAGIERRSARTASGTGSAGGTMTPVSENGAFSFETESVGSSSETRHSLREYDNNSSSDEGSVTSKVSARGASQYKAPSLILSAAEKRKSALF
jgi:hypothetical protein